MKKIKLLSLILLVLVLTSFKEKTLIIIQHVRDCETSEADKFNSGGYVSGGYIYTWKRLGKDIVPDKRIKGDCKDLRNMAMNNSWIYTDVPKEDSK